MRRLTWLLPVLCVAAGGELFAGSIDVDHLRKPWRREVVREFEVGRDPVRWRQRVSRKEGVLAGVRFEAPLAREAVWTRSTDYSDVGRLTPGVEAVRILEDTPGRRVIQVDVKILWKRLRLIFEVEQDPPREIRFRWDGAGLGQFRGLCVLEDVPPGRTAVELSTSFKPARPVPLSLLLVVERIAILQAVREFLRACEQGRTSTARHRDSAARVLSSLTP